MANQAVIIDPCLRRDDINNLEKKYQQEYGVAVFDVEVKNIKGEIEISGKVLVENQKDDILNVFRDKKIKIKKINLKILSDAGKRNEIGWAVVKTKVADLKLRFVANEIINNKILKRIRCSQSFQGEILRILFKKDDQLLVQQNDLTLGWINKNEIVLKRESLYKKWAKGNFALKGKVINPDKFKFAKKLHGPAGAMEPAAKTMESVVKEAEKFLGVKYVLGGKSKEGVDCSGLTQIIYKNAFNIILPKHSWDQKEMGKKVNLKNIKSGDLIFLIKKINQHRHVGVIEKNNKNINLIHASTDKKKVVKWDFNKISKNYDFVEARRIVELHE